ncbi:MAG: TonB-dependent receptor [Sphingomonadales bacterium]|nr:TonB-dependent receptor [Sphingomonadales bacterium]
MNHVTTRVSRCAVAAVLALGIAAPVQAQSTTEAPADIIVTARRVEERLQDVPISISVLSQSQLSAHNIVSAGDLARTTPSLQVNTGFGNENTTFSLRGFSQDISSAPTVGTYFADVVAPRGGSFSTPAGEGAGPGAFFDLQNVQVLKGPQGTLQGRNTTGGAVMLVPAKPTRKLEGYIEGTVGNFDAYGVQAVLNVPFSDAVRVRLGIDKQKRDGYLINGSGIGPKDFNNLNYTALRASVVVDLAPNIENYTIGTYTNSHTHGSVQKVFAAGVGQLQAFALDQLQRQAGLGFYGVLTDMPDSSTRTRQWQVINTTKWLASDNLTIKNIISYGEYRQQLRQPQFATNFRVTPAAMYGYLGYFNAIANHSVLPGAAASPQTPPFAAAIINAQLGLGGIPDPSTWTNGNLAATINGLNGALFNYAQINPNPGHEFSAAKTFTEELQFQGNFLDGKLNWQAGFYFEKSSPIGVAGAQTTVQANCPNINSSSPSCVAPLAIALNSYFANAGANLTTVPFAGLVIPSVLAASLPLSGGYNPSLYTNATQDTALYTQATYKLTPQISLTAGFRYTWDKQTTTDDPRFVGYTANLAGAPILTTFCANTALPMPAGGCYAVNSNKSSRPTWLIGLDWKPMEDVLVYAKYARGYRAGGVKPDVIQTITSTVTGVTTRIDSWKPEKVDAFEIGLKSSFHGAISGIFNLAAFYNNFSDQQVMLGISAVAAPVPGQSSILNAGKSRIYGLEASTSLNLFKGFVLNFDYTYLNTKVKSVGIQPGLYVGTGNALVFAQPGAVAGMPLSFSPKNKFSVNANYTLINAPTLGAISVGATFTHTDSQYSNFNDIGASSTVLAPNGVLTPTTSNLGIIQATNLLDFNAGWTNVGGAPVDLSFFMTNVTGQKYYTQVPGLLGLGVEVASVGAPRLFGFRAKIHF